jgi:TolB-like protein
MQPPSAERPTNDEAVVALNRVLGGEVFEAAGRAREFLTFIVQETLAGRGDRLKGYSIAVRVFERPADFDAQTDPLVRVEAGRLRRRLAEYYQSQGREDVVRIELPRGGYTPVFVRHLPDPAALVEPPAASPRSRGRTSWWPVGAAALVLIALTAGLGWMLFAGQSPPAQASAGGTGAQPPPIVARGPRLVVLPLATLGEGTGPGFARGVTDEVIKSLVDLHIFATASPAAQSLEPASLATLREDYQAGYALSGTVRTDKDNDRVRVTVRLTDTEFGTQLWTWALDDDRVGSGLLASQETIGESIGKIVSSPYGPVFGHEIDRIAGRAGADLDPFQCLMRFYEYSRAFSVARHAEVLGCMERSVARAPKFAPGWSALAVLYLHEYIYGYNPQPGRAPALDRALNAVGRSLDLDSSGRVAAAGQAGVEYARGNTRGFADAVEQALAIKPVHPVMAAQIGLLLTVSGEGHRGAQLVQDALPFSVHVPAWNYTAFAFRYLQTRQYEEALQWSLKVDAPNWFIAPMTVAASAELAGRHDIAEREVKRLLELEPDFVTKGPELLRRWRLNDELLEVLLSGLRGAGLEIP